MDTIVIRYYQQVKSGPSGAVCLTPLGKETLESISEALLPSSAAHKVFCIKKFTGVDNYRWHVEGVCLVSLPSVSPVVYAVTLSKIFQGPPEEYLQKTMTKRGSSLSKIIQSGTVVEVDYGFIQTIGREDGLLKTNKRYSDTLQKGEMHKRRLAVVVRVNRNVVQVAPVTSDPQSPNDKTTFQLSRETLDQLTVWGSSGKQSWVISSMIESVSASRILPPITDYEVRGVKRKGRNLNYVLRLTPDEKELLKGCLTHTIGVTDYQQTKDRLAAAQQQITTLAPMQAALAAANAKIAQLELERTELVLVNEVANDWDKRMGGGCLQKAVDELRELYSEIEGEPAGG